MRTATSTLLLLGWLGCASSSTVADSGTAPPPTCPANCPTGLSCSDGRCAPIPCSAQGKACPSPASCIGGFCANSSCDPPCSPGQACLDQLCIGEQPGHCSADADCSGGGTCLDGFCTQAGCSPPCASGQVCLDDLCVPTSGNTACSRPYAGCESGIGPYCANLARDSSNCGACGNVCPAGQVCDGIGLCAVSCVSGEVECPALGSAKRCVDAQADQENCGSCATQCASGQACSNGSCGTTCSAPFGACGSGPQTYCADPDSDPSNCGGCGNTCAPGAICAGGACGGQCPQPFDWCPSDGGPVCLDPQYDPSNCGSCGVACNAGSTCYGGACVACGDAGEVCCVDTCATGLVCRSGVCAPGDAGS